MKHFEPKTILFDPLKLFFAALMLTTIFVGTSYAQESREDATTPERVSRLEAHVAKLEKRLAAVEAQLAKIGAQAQPRQISRTSRDDGTRFIGNWKGVRSGDYMSISKDGDKYIIREPYAGVFPCELSNGSLKSGTFIGNVDFIESSGHITWRGIEWQKLP